MNIEANSFKDMGNFGTLSELAYLNFGHNFIEKISPAPKYEMLQKLYLCTFLFIKDDNKIKKIDNLNHLANLKILDLEQNKIEKIKNISKLTKLTDLILTNN